MKKIIYFLFLGTLFMACTKDIHKDKTSDSEFSVPADFEWKTLDRKTVTLTETSSVYLERENQTGKTERLLLGEELESGVYNFVVTNFGGQLVTEPVGGLGRSISRADENQNHIYFPAGGGKATMVFEDLFPSTGDLDMNDVVFDFRIMYKLDQKGGGKEARVHYIEIEVWPRAMGGSVYSTIGLAANLLADDFVIKDVKYTNVDVKGELFNVNENGTEINAQSVIPLCANLYDCFGGEKGIINTYEDREKIEVTSSFTVRITFDNSKDNDFPLYSQLSLLAENGKLLDLFAVMGERGREVHRKGCTPTKLFNPEYLSEDSNSLDFCSKSNNYVWALIIGHSFKYPIEKKAINEVYPDFENWVKDEYNDDWTLDAVSDFQYKK